MLYLIKSAGYREEEEGKISTFFLLKIGYTEDSRKEIRYSHYKMHNPTCQVLYEIPGATEDHEKRVQYKFRDLLFLDYGREWFEYSEVIIDFFRSIESLEELENLPKSPSREDKEFKETKKVIKETLPYLLEFTEEEIYSEDKISKKIERELNDLVSLFGDTLSEELVLEHYKEKCPERVSRYNQIKISREFEIYCEDDLINQEVSEFIKKYFSFSTRFEKIKFLCEFDLSKEALEIVLCQIPDNDEVKSYYLALGPQKLRALSYDITRIRKAMGVVMFSPDLLMDSVYSDFREGEKLSLTNIKNKLSFIYSSINYNSAPKATDIERWFEVKECLVSVEVGGKKKRSRGYELLRSKEHELREELKLIG